jgi:hypothetical protein
VLLSFCQWQSEFKNMVDFDAIWAHFHDSDYFVFNVFANEQLNFEHLLYTAKNYVPAVIGRIEQCCAGQIVHSCQQYCLGWIAGINPVILQAQNFWLCKRPKTMSLQYNRLEQCCASHFHSCQQFWVNNFGPQSGVASQHCVLPHLIAARNCWQLWKWAAQHCSSLLWTILQHVLRPYAC